MSEDGARRQLELLCAKDIDENDPIIDKFIRQQQHIDVSLRIAPPGVGKTSNLIQDWITRNDERSIFLSFSHELLNEQARHLKNASVEFRHLHGIKSICSCFKENSSGYYTESGEFIEIKSKDFYNPDIHALLNSGVPVNQVCERCKKKGIFEQKLCPYKNQRKNIKNAQIVIAPVEFAALGIFDDYEPDNVTIDDCLLRYQLHPDKFHLELILVDSQERFWGEKSNQHKIIKTLPELFHLSQDDYLERMQIVNSVRNDSIECTTNMNIGSSVESGDYRFLFVNPFDYELYHKYSLQYGYRNQFATPYLFHCFKYIYKNKDRDGEPHLKIMEAAIQPECLNILKTRYFRDENIDINFYNDDFEWKIQDHGSTINEWLGRDGSWFPAQRSVANSIPNQQKFQNLVKWRTSGLVLKSIGVIRPQKCQLENLLPENFKIPTLSLYDGNLRGKNSLEKCEHGFVAGTYSVPGESVIEDYQFLTASTPITTELIDKDQHGDWYHFEDKKLEALRWHKNEYEQAQAIMRFRPGLHEVVIDVMGKVPSIIEEWGFKVNHYRLNARGDGMKEDEREIWLIIYLKEHNNHVPERVARDEMVNKFKINFDLTYRIIKKNSAVQ